MQESNQFLFRVSGIFSRTRVFFLIILLSLSFSCLRVNVPPLPLPDKKSKSAVLSPGAPMLILQFQGKEIENKNWIQALSISRLFFSSIENKSGSLTDILRPAVQALIQAKGYRHSHLKKKTAAVKKTQQIYLLQIHLQKHILYWLPPVEFIQTPSPRRKGKIRLDFEIHTKISLMPVGASSAFLEKLSTEKPVPEKSPENLLENLLEKSFTKPYWKDVFQKKAEYLVFPGNERESLEFLAHETLATYIQKLQKLLDTSSDR